MESAAFDIDFKTKITREQFERACSDLRSRFAKPIYDALANAGLNLVGRRRLPIYPKLTYLRIKYLLWF